MTDKDISEYVLALVPGNEDLVIFRGRGTCMVCAERKLDIIKMYDISRADAEWYKSQRIRFLNVKCECQKS